MAGYISSSREARNLVYNVIESEKVALGVGYVGVDDERRLPQYPAVVVSAGPKTKELHGTHTWQIELRTIIWVYHANLSLSHKQRSDADLQLVEAIEAALELDMTFNEAVVYGYIENETPGVFQPRSQKGEMVVGTRMVHYINTQARF